VDSAGLGAQVRQPSLPLEIIHLNTLPAVTSRKAGGLRSRRRRANDSRQQQLGGFVALARESAQLTTNIRFYRAFRVAEKSARIHKDLSCHPTVMERS